MHPIVTVQCLRELNQAAESTSYRSPKETEYRLFFFVRGTGNRNCTEPKSDTRALSAANVLLFVGMSLINTKLGRNIEVKITTGNSFAVGQPQIHLMDILFPNFWTCCKYNLDSIEFVLERCLYQVVSAKLCLPRHGWNSEK